MKGSIGTSTTIKYLKGPRGMFKTKTYAVCTECRTGMPRGTWAYYSPRGTYKHVKCPR